MIKLTRKAEEERQKKVGCNSAFFRKTFVLDSEGNIIAPKRVFEMRGDMDPEEQERLSWIEQWEVEDDCIAVEVLCTNSRWGHAFSHVYCPPRISVEQITGVEDLLGKFGISLIGQDIFKNVMAYVGTGVSIEPEGIEQVNDKPS